MSRSNQWFVPGEGIAREVITADIQRYLGPDALVRPGAGTGDFEVRRSLLCRVSADHTSNDQAGPSRLLDNGLSNSDNGTFARCATYEIPSLGTRLTTCTANDPGLEIGLAAMGSGKGPRPARTWKRR